ncbi:MAG: glycosyltransferase family 2 protein [Thauera phenolivorans]|uniref:Glycosyltransferase family 2 protein n=1 Tax=Thauera phenolivorans TaxID=1792543 RepID=A0A7X7LWR6_9RHOO|nr:glycosyltransferase family 2 protein [Thauera phenolivorans]
MSVKDRREESMAAPGIEVQPHELSIVIPVLDEAAGVVEHLQALQGLRAQGVELVVVDGGSRDDTVALAAPLADRVEQAGRGRGRQMNAGARCARGRVLLFLHADTRLPADALPAVRQAIGEASPWGRFDVRIVDGPAALAMVAWAMNLRSRLTGIATGDQAMFCTRAAFDRAGGFPEIPLMEDIVLSRRLRAIARPACLRTRVETSGRRWARHGVVRTVLTMWWLRLRFWLGASPEALARAYGYAPR